MVCGKPGRDSTNSSPPFNRAPMDSFTSYTRGGECYAEEGDHDGVVRTLELVAVRTANCVKTRMPFDCMGRTVANLQEWIMRSGLLLIKSSIALEEYTLAKQWLRIVFLAVPADQAGLEREKVVVRELYHDTCVVEYRPGNYSMSAHVGAKAVKTNRTYPHAHRHLALSLLKAKALGLGDIDAAMGTMRKAVAYEAPSGDQEAKAPNTNKAPG